MLICSELSVSLAGPSKLTSTLSSLPAACAPALMVCQKELAVPLGITTMLILPPTGGLGVPSVVVAAGVSAGFSFGQPQRVMPIAAVIARPPVICCQRIAIAP